MLDTSDLKTSIYVFVAQVFLFSVQDGAWCDGAVRQGLPRPAGEGDVFSGREIYPEYG